MRFTGSGASDTGLVREQNEDAGFVSSWLALVADGVGGAAAGEVASATTAYVVSESVRARGKEDLRSVLAGALAQVAGVLAAEVERDPERDGLATTLTALATDGVHVVLAHVGDSRAYLFREGGLARISTDHTYVQKLVDEGHLETSAMHRHPWRHVVLRSVHAASDGEAEGGDVVALSLAAGDRLMLCSDGLTDMVPEQRITEVLAVPAPRAAADRLVADALEAGGTDNITCVVVDVGDGPPDLDEGTPLGALRDPENVAAGGRVAPDPGPASTTP